MIQFVRFAKHKGEGYVYIIPEKMIYAETFEKTEQGKVVKGTIIHVDGKEGKVFVKETPEEINAILRKLNIDAEVDKLRRQAQSLQEKVKPAAKG